MLIPDAFNGIDISGLQDKYPLDASAIRDAGFEFVYVKSSQYSTIRDLKFRKLVDACVKAGLWVGAYHFCSHDTDPVAQANHFYGASGGLGKLPGELPPMADWEYCTPAKYNNHPAHCVRWIERFTDECDRLWYAENPYRMVPRHTVVYTYPSYSMQHQPDLMSSSKLGLRPLCYASYSNYKGYVPKTLQEVPFHKVPAPWSKATLVQYSGDNGLHVPGITGACDRDVFLGSSTEWDEFRGLLKPVDSIEGQVKEDVVTNE